MSNQASSSPAGEKRPLLGHKGSPSVTKTTLDQAEKNAGANGAATEAEESDDTVEKDNKVLAIAFVMMIVFQLGNRIFGKLQTFPMHNYPLFMNMMSSVIYVPLSFLYILPVQWFTKDIITKDQTNIPKYQFAVMGFLDSVAGIMAVFAINYITNSSIIVLVQQSAIPISMVISRITLNARYTMNQYIGAGIVLLGIGAVLLPTFFAPASAAAGSSQLPWIALLIFSCIPMCLSSVYKEKALGEVDIDVIYMNGWVAIFQTLAAIPLCFPSAYIIGLNMDQIWPNMYEGFLCWFGMNSIAIAEGSLQVDDCTMAPLYVNIYLFFNVVFNVLIIVILKHGSANIMWMASTVIVPLSNVAFSLNFMPNHTTLHPADWAGLGIIMSGLVIYRFYPALVALYMQLTGVMSPEEKAARKQAIKIGKAAEKKQLQYFGFNQLEGVETLMDSRITKVQKKKLYRNPVQIRSNYLTRLGIPPSPHVTLIRGQGKSNNSPAIPMRVVNKQRGYSQDDNI
jgi:uncharacterized membrane protein